MAPQATCSGLLIFEQATNATGTPHAVYRARCLGAGATVAHGEEHALDEHHESRQLTPEHRAAELWSYRCLGWSQYATSQGNEATPPPMCLGIEYMQMVAAQRQHQHAPVGLGELAHAPDAAGVALKRPDELLDATCDASAGEHALGTGHVERVSAAEHAHGAVHHLAQQQQVWRQQQHEWQQQQQQKEQEEEEAPRSVLARAHAAHAELSERLKDQDPLWFAKAFSHRASLNWASMQRMAGDLAAAALSDLGWRERDETAED